MILYSSNKVPRIQALISNERALEGGWIGLSNKNQNLKINKHELDECWEGRIKNIMI